MTEAEPDVQNLELPMVFQVKYLGQQPSRGLWGIKHTRKPVDDLVAKAKTATPELSIPRVSLTVSKDGVTVTQLTPGASETHFLGENIELDFPIEHVSYGVQDLVYTRVFTMIVVREITTDPFECHAFVCRSRNEARQMTYALASAFHEYSASLKDQTPKENSRKSHLPVNQFSIDLRTPEQLAGSLEQETEA